MGAETAAINKKSAAQSAGSLANRYCPARVIWWLSYYESRVSERDSGVPHCPDRGYRRHASSTK